MYRYVKLLISALILSIGMGVSGYFIQQGFVKMKAMDRYVTVKGLAEREVKSDKVIWRLMFNFASDDLVSTYQGMADAQKKIQQFLTAQGFKPEELEVQLTSVADNEGMSYSSSTKVKRYNASSSVTLVTSNVDQVQKALQQASALLQSGIVLSGSEVHYLFTQLNNIKPDMLTQATNNAKEAADTFAKNSRSRLGSIRQASQGLFTVQNADDSYGDNDINKKIRVVTTVSYFLGR